jgi:hypothetical protein
MRRFALSLLPALAAAVLAALSLAAGNSLGPPGGTICTFDETYRTIATPTSVPNDGPFRHDLLFLERPACASGLRGRSRHGNNGGRWKVVRAFGITSQPTNAGGGRRGTPRRSSTPECGSSAHSSRPKSWYPGRGCACRPAPGVPDNRRAVTRPSATNAGSAMWMSRLDPPLGSRPWLAGARVG